MPAYARAQICRHPHRDRPAHTPDASSTLTKQVSADGFAHFKRQSCPLRFSLSLSLFSPCPSLSFHSLSSHVSAFCLCLSFLLSFCFSHFFPLSVSHLPSQSFAVSLTFILALFPFLTFSLSPSFFYSLALSLTFSPPPPPSPSLSFQQISALAPKRLTAHNLSHVTQKQLRAVAL